MITRTKIVVLIAILFLTACAEEPATSIQIPEESLKLLSSTFPVHLIARNVTRDIDGLELKLLIPGAQGCPHNYSLVPRDMQALAKSDVLIINGLGLEEFLGKPIERANAELKILNASRGISEILNYMDTNDDHGHSHDTGVVNPHIFTSPLLAGAMAESIAQQLAEMLPEHEQQLLQNARLFSDEMQTLNQEIKTAVEGLGDVRLVAQHGIFDYLARDTGMRIVAVLQSSAGEDNSASNVIELVKTAVELQATAVIAEPQYSSRLARTVAAEAGLPYGVLDPLSSGPNNAPLDYYQQKMRENIMVLKDLNEQQ